MFVVASNSADDACDMKKAAATTAACSIDRIFGVCMCMLFDFCLKSSSLLEIDVNILCLVSFVWDDAISSSKI